MVQQKETMGEQCFLQTALQRDLGEAVRRCSVSQLGAQFELIWLLSVLVISGHGSTVLRSAPHSRRLGSASRD